MPSFIVYEKQILTVAYEVNADNEADAAALVESLGVSEYDYIVDSETSIESVEEG